MVNGDNVRDHLVDVILGLRSLGRDHLVEIIWLRSLEDDHLVDIIRGRSLEEDHLVETIWLMGIIWLRSFG